MIRDIMLVIICVLGIITVIIAVNQPLPEVCPQVIMKHPIEGGGP